MKNGPGNKICLLNLQSNFNLMPSDRFRTGNWYSLLMHLDCVKSATNAEMWLLLYNTQKGLRAARVNIIIKQKVTTKGALYYNTFSVHTY